MAQFGDLPLTIVRSISAVSGDTYEDIDDDQLKAELSERGFEPSRSTLVGVMHQLQDAGYLSCTFTGRGIALIRLEHAGRQQVEGWPTSPGSLSAADVESLVTALRERSEDVTVAEPERTKARAAASALSELGLSVTGEVIAAWLKHLGVG
jgi:DNA-binding PadR family transcriptional regulator